MNWSDLLSIVAIVISVISLLLPFWNARPNAKVTELMTLPEWKNTTWIYAVVFNKSTHPLSIHGASLDGIRLYRHQHYFTKSPTEGIQLSTSFPVSIPPQSEKAILMEFVNQNREEITRDSPVTLVLYADRKPIVTTFVINQIAITPETALREI